MEHMKSYNLTVFPSPSDPEHGGNPTAIFLAADDTLTRSEMQSLAQEYRHECGFVLLAPENDASCHYTMRYWVPNHEMEMCGHATVGAVWLLQSLHLLPDAPSIRISTLSGVVEARVVPSPSDSTSDTAPSEHSILVSQPTSIVEVINADHIHEILSSLNLKETDLITGLKIQNARTSRTKTLIPVKDRATLGSLSPNPKLIQSVCEKIESTGLYPYVTLDPETQLFEARQFPRSSGYLEDPATGIAAAALVFGLVQSGVIDARTESPIVVRQGWLMGKPSEIRVLFRRECGVLVGCWISGEVRWKH
ncbi:hypothetical protein N7488_003543 [Penicillium malachiteum]|nr:hypothetical protein N7488_003543 [Penicillium malachiteum]